MRKFYKTILAMVMMLFAVVANAENIFTWNGNGVKVEEDLILSGGTATAKGGDTNVVAGSKQKNNWCLKLGKTYMVSDVQTHYVEIELAKALKGGEEIALNAFITDAAKAATLGIDFNGSNEISYDVEDALTDNGVPPTTKKLTVPAEAAGCTKVRVYRKQGNTTPYVSMLTIDEAAATPIVLDVVDAEVSDTEIWNIYQNEDYKLHLDIVKNLPLDPARTYTLEDMDVSYSYIYDKNEVVAAQYGKNWKRYEFTSISVKIGANNELEAVLEAKNGEDVISGTFVFNNPDPITVTLNGETEYFGDQKTYGVSAKNKGSELKADYTVQFGIKGESYESKNTFTIDDLMANGNTICVATKETKIKTASITLTVGADSQTYEGTVVGEDEKTYAINVTTNIPSKEAKKETVDFGAVLSVSEDEGDIKLVAENEDAKFVGYITVDPVTTDVPSGEYNLLSYTKYGKNSDFGYMLDAVEDGKVTVTNNEGEISIVATFKQNNVEYTVTAKSAAPGPKLETVTITESEGAYTVTSTSEKAALYTLCKPMSWLDEGETPESEALAQIAGMASMIDSEETWELYDHMGMEPAPKTFTVADYQEMYAGEEMFLVAVNVGWDGEKLGIISNVALQYFTVPDPTGITNVTVAPAAKAVVKFVENGKLVIVKDNKKYGVDAVEMK